MARKRAVFSVNYSYQYEGDDEPEIGDSPFSGRTVAAPDALAAANEVIAFEMKQTAPTYDDNGDEVKGGPLRKCVKVQIHSVEKKDTIDATVA